MLERPSTGTRSVSACPSRHFPTQVTGIFTRLMPCYCDTATASLRRSPASPRWASAPWSSTCPPRWRATRQPYRRCAACASTCAAWARTRSLGARCRWARVLCGITQGRHVQVPSPSVPGVFLLTGARFRPLQRGCLLKDFLSTVPPPSCTDLVDLQTSSVVPSPEPPLPHACPPPGARRRAAVTAGCRAAGPGVPQLPSLRHRRRCAVHTPPAPWRHAAVAGRAGAADGLGGRRGAGRGAGGGGGGHAEVRGMGARDGGPAARSVSRTGSRGSSGGERRRGFWLRGRRSGDGVVVQSYVVLWRFADAPRAGVRPQSSQPCRCGADVCGCWPDLGPWWLLGCKCLARGVSLSYVVYPAPIHA